MTLTVWAQIWIPSMWHGAWNTVGAHEYLQDGDKPWPSQQSCVLETHRQRARSLCSVLGRGGGGGGGGGGKRA